jgi:8-oxo-dGTP diphosphatase
MPEVKVLILPRGHVPGDQLTYVVIGAREQDRWIFVRHRERTTWELPAGHIEPGEDALEAAERELYEETGTLRSEMSDLSDYQVEVDGKREYGRLFLARVLERGELPEHEIAEIRTLEKMPAPMTYPEVQELLFRVLERQLR